MLCSQRFLEITGRTCLSKSAVRIRIYPAANSRGRAGSVSDGTLAAGITGAGLEAMGIGIAAEGSCNGCAGTGMVADKCVTDCAGTGIGIAAAGIAGDGNAGVSSELNKSSCCDFAGAINKGRIISG